jgi:hypothetical protein
MKCKVEGLTFYRDDDGTRPYLTLALAEVDFPELGLHLAGVRLTHSSNHGYAALAPAASVRGVRTIPIRWGFNSALGLAARDALLEMYERMDGPGHEAVRNNVAAGRRVAERKAEAALSVVDAGEAAGKATERTITVTTKPRKPVPVPVRTTEEMDMAEMGLSRPVDPAVLRTLGMAS